MKLHTKLSLTILSGLIVIIVIAQVLQYFDATRQIAALSDQNLTLLKAREEVAVKNIFRSVERSVSGSLERGEMEKFTKLLADQREVEGLLEFSLYNRQGSVTYSSDAVFLKKALPEKLRTQLLTVPRQILQYADDAVEIYQPQKVTPDCVRCHQTWQTGSICGVTSMRFSTAALAATEQRAQATLRTVKHSFLITSLASWAGIMLVSMVTMAWAVRAFIKQPLRRVTALAQQIATGDLTVEVARDERRDEIGMLNASFRQMPDYLHGMAGIAKQIASGNLTVAVSTRSENDVLGHALADMGNHLRHQLQELRAGINVLASSANDISASVTQLASSAAETSSSVGETTTTIEEVRQTSGLASQKAQQVSANAQHAAEIGQSGRKATDDTVVAMTRIRDQMTSIADSIVKLSEQSQAIGGIISTVSDLADQSNLLAVNASVEATKAGEQGKGFTVVAQEIRSLAEQSKQATTQVQTILNNIQKATGKAVMATEQGTKAVEAGMTQAQDAGESIRLLAGNILESAQAMNQIAISSQEQMIGVNQITDAMESIRQASLQNVDSANQLEAAAHNLQTLGKSLKQVVEQYQV